MREQWTLWLYSLATWLAIPLLKRKLRRRARAEPGYALAVPERFGDYSDSARPAGGRNTPLIWLHAVSLGETRVAGILLAQLRARWPGLRLLLTHSTATGRAEGAKLLQTGDAQVWLPWDTPAAVQRFLRHFQPDMGVLLETEVWPNLVAQCRAAQIPLVLANARLNAKSMQGAQRLAWLARPAYAGLTQVWAQTPADAQRLRALDAPVTRVLGNIKFDASPDAAQLTQGCLWQGASARPIVLLASTREGEEALWLQALAQHSSVQSAVVQWLLVPRHPQRFDAVEGLCQQAGLSVSRRSQWTAGPQPADVWLGDSMGEMTLYYAMAHVALLGGSFAPLGGQNLIEAAACGCPVVMGPHTFNFSQIADQAQQQHAALRVDDMSAGINAACALAADADRHAQMAQHRLTFAQAHRGATRATVKALVQLLQARRP